MRIEDQTAFEAMKLAYSGEYEKAIIKFEEFLKREPRQIQMMGELCNCYAETKRYEDMEKLALKALNIAQNIANTDNIGRFYSYIAKSHLYRENNEAAAKYFRLAIANKPHYIPNYLELAYALYDLGEYEKAVELFKKIIDMNPDYAKNYEIEKKISITYNTLNEKNPARYLFVSGFQAENEKNYSLAKREYNGCLKLEPEHLEAMYGLFSIAKEEGLTLKAIEIGEKLFALLQKFENKNKDYIKPPVYIGLSMVYGKMENIDKSAEYGQWFYTTVLMDDAQKALEKKDYDEALKHYLKALKTREDSFDVLDKIIDYYYTLGKLEFVGEYIDRALKLAMEQYDKERVADYCFKFAKYFVMQDNVEQAKRYWELGANTSSDINLKLKANFYIGKMFYIKENYGEALKYFEFCEELVLKGAVDTYDVVSSLIKTRNMLDENSDMNIALRHFNAGRELRIHENYEDAVKEYETSLKYRPQVLDVMWELAFCYSKLDKVAESAEVSEEGFKVSMQTGDNRFAEVFAYNVGLYNIHKQNYEKALRYFTEAHHFDPENQVYIKLMEDCQVHIQGNNTIH